MPIKKSIKKAPVKKVAPKKASAKAPVKKVVAKKSTKKAPLKKATLMKASAKKQVRALVCAPGEQCFWTTDGRVLEDLNQLQMAFGSMEDEVFLHHVTKEKNDFADWVEHVLDDATCAAALRRSKKASSARTVVLRCLRLYSV